MTPPEIEPTTFRFVAHYLIQLCHRVHHYIRVIDIDLWNEVRLDVYVGGGEKHLEIYTKINRVKVREWDVVLCEVR
jgi:allantoicase